VKGPGKWSAPGPALALGGPASTYCDLVTQPVHSHFTHTEISSFQSQSHYWEEDNISVLFSCNIR